MADYFASSEVHLFSLKSFTRVVVERVSFFKIELVNTQSIRTKIDIHIDVFESNVPMICNSKCTKDEKNK